MKSRASLIPPGNLFANPTDFAHASWTKFGCTISSNVAIAPDGSYTADKIVDDGANSTHSVDDGVAVVNGARYFIQIYAKSLGQSRYLGLSGLLLAGSDESPVFNLDNGVIDFGNTSTLIVRNSGASMTHVGDGWFRCKAYVLSGNTTQPIFNSTSPTTNNSMSNNQGDSSSGILIWGAYYRQA
jgi:hypothetical protein